MTNSPDSVPQSVTREGGATIAYHRRQGKSPGVVFLTGFKSDMTGGKALAMEALCAERGQAFLRFDYTGHGASSGAFEDGTIGAWADDAVFALDRLSDGPQVLVGSSMGGWIMLLAALARAERIAGLIGIAAAPDFTEDLIAGELTPAQKKEMERDGCVHLPNCYDDGEPYIVTKALIDDGREHLLLRADIALDVPVRLIHGMNDEDVPWRTSLVLAEKLRSTDVEMAFVKDGDHRLSEGPDLDRLRRIVTALLDDLERT